MLYKVELRLQKKSAHFIAHNAFVSQSLSCEFINRSFSPGHACLPHGRWE